ncbi:MAG: SRPBCC family protein [Terracidiphilus sp.]
MAESEFVYVTYIRTTPEKLWRALTEPEFTRKFWVGTVQECEWKAGAAWKMLAPDGRVADAGKVVEIDPPRKLVLTWQNHLFPQATAEGFSRMTYELDAKGGTVKLTVTHTMERKDSLLVKMVSNGWPNILASLKSLLETGEALEGTDRWPEGL